MLSRLSGTPSIIARTQALRAGNQWGKAAVAEINHFEYGWITPALSYALSVLGSILGLVCAGRIRIAGSAGQRALWGLLSAWALGGTAIWAMHFMAMLGFAVQGTRIRYDVPLTAASTVIAVVAVGIGLAIVGTGRLNPVRLVGGGIFTGVGVAAMHYTGMAAMRLKGSLGYDGTRVVLSVVIAIVAATVALWLAMTVRRPLAIVVSALVMGVAVNGMHFTGMSALGAPARGPGGRVRGRGDHAAGADRAGGDFRGGRSGLRPARRAHRRRSGGCRVPGRAADPGAGRAGPRRRAGPGRAARPLHPRHARHPVPVPPGHAAPLTRTVGQRCAPIPGAARTVRRAVGNPDREYERGVPRRAT
ncbi:hypothetical protein GCM10027614_13500 [Micromonospora vulcania]